MSWAIDLWNDKMDRDAGYYEKVIRPRYVERVRAIWGVFPELSAEDIQGIKHDIEWTENMTQLREKINQIVIKKGR